MGATRSGVLGFGVAPCGLSDGFRPLPAGEAAMLVAMWRNDEGIYLEPGEISVLADLARQAVPPGPPQHPKDLMLAALAAALSDMPAAAGVVVVPAPASVAREAARAHLRPPAGLPLSRCVCKSDRPA